MRPTWRQHNTFVGEEQPVLGTLKGRCQVEAQALLSSIISEQMITGIHKAAGLARSLQPGCPHDGMTCREPMLR